MQNRLPEEKNPLIRDPECFRRSRRGLAKVNVAGARGTNVTRRIDNNVAARYRRQIIHELFREMEDILAQSGSEEAPSAPPVEGELTSSRRPIRVVDYARGR